MNLNVCALTSSVNFPSARYRIRQHIQPLRRHGIDVTEYCPRVASIMPMPGRLAHVRRRYVAPLSLAWMGAHALSRIPGIIASWQTDLVWIERTVVPGFDEAIHLLGRPRILDIDDAIWLEGVIGRSAPTIAGAVNVVVAGNRYLRDWAAQYCRTVCVVPTAVDVQRVTPSQRTKAEVDRRFVIGWTGSSYSLRYIEDIQDALALALRAIPGASLLIVADRAPRFPALSGLDVQFVPWSPRTEVESLREMDVGVMPLPDNEYTRGKCSFKMLQYMAAGLPSVVSPVGMNRDLLEAGDVGIAASSTSDWVDALVALHHDSDRRSRIGRAARALAERDFDVGVVAAQLAAVFMRAAGVAASSRPL